MKQKLKIIIVTFLLLVSVLVGSTMTMAKTDNKIIFRDKNLQNALIKYYDCNEEFTKEKASELSQNEDNLFLDYCDISDLEGLQYFNSLIQVNLRGNTLSDLSVLPKLKNLFFIDISYNTISGKKFENIFEKMGNIRTLQWIYLMNDQLTNINFLNKMGNIENYSRINMEENRICNISILEEATNLERLYMSDNRITDVTPLKNLKKLTKYLDLRDNCILDYKPIKPLLDDMFADVGNETGLERYDYYNNPVNFKYNGKIIKFPYLTAYYKYQAYVEASPLFKALGGSATYDKMTGTLTCKYDGKVLVMKDFSKEYTLNGKKKSLYYPMRRMQYNLAYIPVKDICEILDLNYNIIKTRKIHHDLYAPKLIEISKIEKELG